MDLSLRNYYLQELGITQWVLRKPKSLTKSVSEALPSLDALQKQVSECQKCALSQSRTHTVFARGHAKARLFIIGEAPGFHEDQQGRPFVGKAGHLLDRMITSIGFLPEDVYIANVIKCRPPENRDPKDEEIKRCSEYLRAQIKAVQPSCILALGRFAGHFVTQTQQSLAEMRKRVHTFEGIQTWISYHPAYLLRNPKDKKKAYEDLRKVQEALSSPSQTA